MAKQSTRKQSVKRAGSNKGKRYEKPLSLHPMEFEEAVTVLLKVKPKAKKPK